MLPPFVGAIADKIGFKNGLIVAFTLLTIGYFFLGVFHSKALVILFLLIYIIIILILFLYNIAGSSGWLKTKGQALHDQLSRTIVLAISSPKIPIRITGITSVIVLSIITIFLSISKSGYYHGGSSSEKISSVKSNMHTLQTIVENYAVDNKHFYPSSLEELYKEANKHNYWKDFSNPYTSVTGIGINGSLLNYKDYNVYILNYCRYRGLVLYNSLGNPPVKYFIYGCGRNGQLIQDKGQNFV